MNVYFEVYVDHSALVHIMKAKTEPQTMRIQKLIEKLQGYSFVVLYHKGADMKVADFMSRHPDNDMDSPHEIIPIAFSLEDLEEIAMEKPRAKETVEQCLSDGNWWTTLLW